MNCVCYLPTYIATSKKIQTGKNSMMVWDSLVQKKNAALSGHSYPVGTIVHIKPSHFHKHQRTRKEITEEKLYLWRACAPYIPLCKPTEINKSWNTSSGWLIRYMRVMISDLTCIFPWSIPVLNFRPFLQAVSDQSFMKSFKTIVLLWQISLYEDGLPAPKEIDSQQSRSAEDHCTSLLALKFPMNF